MMAGLDSYFQNKVLDYDEFSPCDAPYLPRQPYDRLLCHQDQIGWDHFLRGKLSYHWTGLQQDFIWRTSPGTTFDRDKWLRLIIKPLFTACQDLWTIRNDERHGKDAKTKKGLRTAQVDRDLRALYLLQPEVLAADRDLFRDSVDEHLTDAIYTIRQWVRSYSPIIYRSRREARHRSISNLKLLPKYFHPLKSGKRKRKYYKSSPSPIPVYESTRMSDHFHQVPQVSTPVARTDKQLIHIVRNFQQLPLIFGGDHPT